MVELNGFAIYSRVSTQSQNIETQIRECREYCTRSGVINYKTYADVGLSGTTSSRPQLDEMMRDVRAGKVKVIVIYKLDRLGRSLANLFDLLAELRNRNVRLISISDGLDSQTDNPMSRAFWQLLAVFSQLEKEIIVERVRSGLARAVAQGKKLGRPAGSKDRGQRSRSGYFLRYCGRSAKQRKIGPRMTNVTPEGNSNDPVEL